MLILAEPVSTCLPVAYAYGVGFAIGWARRGKER